MRVPKYSMVVLAATAIVASSYSIWRFSHQIFGRIANSSNAASRVRQEAPRLLREVAIRILHIVGENQVTEEELEFDLSRSVFCRGWLMELDEVTGNVISLRNCRHNWGVTTAEAHYLDDSPDIPSEKVRIAKMKRVLRSLGIPDPVVKEPTTFMKVPDRIVFYGIFHSELSEADFVISYDFQLDRMLEVRVDGDILNPDFRMFPDSRPKAPATVR